MNGEPLLPQILFWLFAVAACGGALAVVIAQNVVRMAFWLVVSLGSVGGLFFLLNADFVAAAQLLIYVGGTVVLLIFGVMLTASGPFVRIRMSPAEGFLAGAVGLAFLVMVLSTVSGTNWNAVNEKLDTRVTLSAREGYNPPEVGNTTRPLGLKLLGLSVEDVGNPEGEISNGYLLPFEIASVHLLVVLIGAAYLARTKKRREQAEEGVQDSG